MSRAIAGGVAGGSALTFGVPCRIAASTSDVVGPVNARVPVSISNRTVPNAQTSERRVTSAPRICSGLMYDGVPINAPCAVKLSVVWATDPRLVNGI